MGERINRIDTEIAELQQRKAEAIQTVFDCNERILALGSEKNRLLGAIAGRHLYVVPDYPYPEDRPEPDGVA